MTEATQELIVTEATQEPTLAETATPLPEKHIVWSADHETGDLSQWQTGVGSYTPEQDSGDCARPPTVVSMKRAHSGRYAIKMTIDTTNGSAGCRQHRNVEAQTGKPYYYSAWFYISKRTRVLNDHWNLFQFKSRRDGTTDPMWSVNINNRPDGTMYLVLKWAGGHYIKGPHKGDGKKWRMYTQTVKNVPVGRWFQIEAYLRQSDKFDGQIIIWQDGVELFNKKGVRTKYPGGDQRWAINNYSNGLRPTPNTIYIDDAVISTTRIGPGGANDSS